MKNKANAALLAGSTLWCLSIIVAPLAGLPAVYDFFSLICHQHPERSWQLFGEPLPVCIRCASIYFAFTISLWLRIPVGVRALRFALAFLLAEFIFARLFLDLPSLRAVSGILVGVSAAPFIKIGVEQMLQKGEAREPV